MQSSKVVILGNIDQQCKTLLRELSQLDYDLITTDNEMEVAQLLMRCSIRCVIIVDSGRITNNPIAATTRLKSIVKCPIILLVAHSTEQLAIRALKAGVDDYFTSPIDVDEVINSVKCCARSIPRFTNLPEPEGVNDKRDVEPTDFVGDSIALKSVKQTALRYAACNSNVLITGETGTGKELVARLIHSYSARKHQSMISVNCAAIPESLLESELFGYEKGAFTGAYGARDGSLLNANRGTFFLDEIGEMSATAQAKILRAIETKVVQRIGGKQLTPVDIRFIAATNKKLDSLIEVNQFRNDLFFRLNVARIHLPALRERKEDIKPLCEHFIAYFNEMFGIAVKMVDEQVLSLLCNYHWPGNVRELRNVIEAIFINQPDKMIQLKDLPFYYYKLLTEVTCVRDEEKTGDAEEREKLLLALNSTNWNKSKAAEKLNWSRMTLYRKIHKYQISVDQDNNTSPFSH